ncbi:MAG: hypothetical protein WCO09_00160 [bacterium]
MKAIKKKHRQKKPRVIRVIFAGDPKSPINVHIPALKEKGLHIKILRNAKRLIDLFRERRKRWPHIVVLDNLIPSTYPNPNPFYNYVMDEEIPNVKMKDNFGETVYKYLRVFHPRQRFILHYKSYGIGNPVLEKWKEPYLRIFYSDRVTLDGLFHAIESLLKKR